MKKWCSTYWLYVTYALGIGVFVALLMNWNIWGLEQKLLAVMGFLLPAHVAEEWQVPGGFHYAYNCLFRSDTPNSYPMNQLADMVTNLSGEIFFVILLFIGANKGMLLAMAALGYIEFIGHTVLLIVMHRRFKPVGKQVRYAPGLATAYLDSSPLRYMIRGTWYRTASNQQISGQAYYDWRHDYHAGGGFYQKGYAVSISQRQVF